ncbi:MAG: hypothetical protein ACPHXR_06450 [Flavicella sp.]
MEIKALQENPRYQASEKLAASYTQFRSLLDLLKTKELSEKTIAFINEHIDTIHATEGDEKTLIKAVKKTQVKILSHLEKEHKIVSKNHYRNMWMAIGMAAFGIPMGAAFGMSLGNMGLLAVGLPMGMAIGIGVGTAMDKKACEEQRQIDFELK